MSGYKRELQIFRDGSLSERRELTIPLREGQQGTVQTLQAMADMVIQQRVQPDLQRFVERQIIAGVAGHDFESEADRIFRFAQSRITYRRDPFGVERVADIWTTLYGLADQPVGDCGIKSCFFAACCAIEGLEPYFVVIRQDANQKDFDHVYAAAVVNGELRYYDPTPEGAPAGYEAPSVDKELFKVFK